MLQLEGCRGAARAVLDGSRREGSGMAEQQVLPSGKKDGMLATNRSE